MTYSSSAAGPPDTSVRSVPRNWDWMLRWSRRPASGASASIGGCIPTKALYSATKLIHQASTAGEMGIAYAPPAIDLEKLAAWKQSVISALVNGIETLFAKQSIRIYPATGTLVGPGRVALETGETLAAKQIVLATGSSPIEIPGFTFDSPWVWSSDDALALAEVPERLAVVGGGVIGPRIGDDLRPPRKPRHDLRAPARDPRDRSTSTAGRSRPSSAR